MKSVGNTNRIKHVVVLMMENRSFDHMLGFSGIPGIEGLTGSESNPLPDGRSVQVSRDASYSGDLEMDPGHEVPDVLEQLFGESKQPSPQSRPNNGFALNYARQTYSTPGGPFQVSHPENVMKCYSPEKLPVLDTLAREYAVCDHWFSSLPGPTWPNRFFAHAATSQGVVGDNPIVARTIFDSLSQKHLPWKIYYHDSCQAMAIVNLWEKAFFRSCFRGVTNFFQDAAAGSLPSYSFIEPRYHHQMDRAGRILQPSNDQHPPYFPGFSTDIRYGEVLISQVYQALRRSPAWEQSLLAVVYDEHGGLYDHVLPPDHMPAPGKKTQARKPYFDFTRLGFRVPAVLISPLIPRGTVDKTIYDHSSIPATIENIFGLEPLTERDAQASSFTRVVSLDAPRQNTPDSLPVPQVPVHYPEYVFDPGRARLFAGTMKTALAQFSLKAFQSLNSLKHNAWKIVLERNRRTQAGIALEG